MDTKNSEKIQSKRKKMQKKVAKKNQKQVLLW